MVWRSAKSIQQVSFLVLKNLNFNVFFYYQRIQLEFLEDKDSNLLKYPFNIKKFLFDYKYSKFYECNRTLAAELVDRFGVNYTQSSTRNEKIMDGIKHFSETMELLFKPYFLFGGTLLGNVF